MNWWDQGYWIIHTARRVPVSNPTQNGANKAAAFLTATNEDDALGMLAAEHAKYVIVDWELPFRNGSDGSLQGRFQNLADWAGIPTSHFYSLCFSRRSDADPWEAMWIYREPYYQSMVYRLMVLGGAAVQPTNSTWVVQLRDRLDANGRRFCEIVNRWEYSRPEDAKVTASQRGPGFEAVGFTPWQPAFSVPAVGGLRIASEFREPTQKANESPMVRIFEVASSR
jgi:asparagine N-glycosylation enzyme membrane subunit Stt3